MAFFCESRISLFWMPWDEAAIFEQHWRSLSTSQGIAQACLRDHPQIAWLQRILVPGISQSGKFLLPVRNLQWDEFGTPRILGGTEIQDEISPIAMRSSHHDSSVQKWSHVETSMIFKFLCHEKIKHFPCFYRFYLKEMVAGHQYFLSDKWLLVVVEWPAGPDRWGWNHGICGLSSPKNGTCSKPFGCFQK